jgi:hypothetical protein
MIVVERKRRRGTDARQDRPPVVLPWHKLIDPAVRAASVAAGALTFPIRKVWRREKVEAAEPSAEELFNGRLASLNAHNLTMGSLLQACVAGDAIAAIRGVQWRCQPRRLGVVAGNAELSR